jgi:hypothetical protein
VARTVWGQRRKGSRSRSSDQQSPKSRLDDYVIFPMPHRAVFFRRLASPLLLGILASRLPVPALLRAGKGFQVKGDRAGVSGVETESWHGWPGFFAIGIDAGRQELDHFLFTPLACQAAPGDVGRLIGPGLGFLLGANREGCTLEQPRQVGFALVVLRSVTIAAEDRPLDQVIAVLEQVRSVRAAPGR